VENQQVSQLNDTDLAWVAGIVEGEAYIGLSKRIKPEFQYVPRIQIINTDGLMLNAVGEILKKRNLAYYRHRWDIDKRRRRKIYDNYGVSNRKSGDIVFVGLGRVKKVLDAILPYMRGERVSRAKIVLEFCNYRLNARNGKSYLPYSEHEHNLYKKLRQIVENPRDYTLNPIRDDIVRTA
jgi:hypothetical protein